MRFLGRCREQDGRIYQISVTDKSKHIFSSTGMPDQASADYFDCIAKGQPVSFSPPKDQNDEYTRRYFPFTKPQLRRIRGRVLEVLEIITKISDYRRDYTQWTGKEFPQNPSDLLTAIDEAIFL